MTFPKRAIAAARLEVPAFEEIEADPRATPQALILVVLSSMAAGLGLTASQWSAPVVHNVMLALLLWMFSAMATYAIGAHLMPEPQTRANVGELLRTIGFATSPGLLRVFGRLPGVGEPIYWIATIWMFAATIIAIRQALDYRSTFRALAVCLVSWIIAIPVTAAAGALLFLVAEEVAS